MAMALSPSHSCADCRALIGHPTCDALALGFGAKAARRFERTCHGLARLIDTSLTAVFLVAGVVQAVFLLFVLAGQTLS